MRTADAPDPDTWELTAQAVDAGVCIGATFPTIAVSAAMVVSREEARAFARSLLAAAGDATERTFPRLSIEKA